MNATSQHVSYPSTPFPIQSKELNQVIELNWEDWCWFMLLLCSDSSSFFLLSHLWRGKTPLLSLKAFPGQTVLSEGSWGRQSLFLQVSGRDIIPARGLLRQYVSMVLTNSVVPGLSSVPSGTDHFWVAHWQTNNIFGSALPDCHHVGFAVGVGAMLSAAMTDCNYPNQAC